MRFVPLAFASLVVVLALSGPPDAAAVTVSIEPADTSVTTGATFTLRVVASAFPDLKGFQLIHTFDPARLGLDSVLAGDVLTGTGRMWASYLVPDVSAPVDSAWMDAAMLDGSAEPPGVIAYLRFRAVARGDAVVECAHVDFRDGANQRTVPACEGGVVHVLGPVPTRRASWGSLKLHYR